MPTLEETDEVQHDLMRKAKAGAACGAGSIMSEPVVRISGSTRGQKLSIVQKSVALTAVHDRLPRSIRGVAVTVQNAIAVIRRRLHAVPGEAWTPMLTCARSTVARMWPR